MNNTQTMANQVFRPQFALYHANGKCTGAAIKFELHPAHDQSEGSIVMILAKQSSVGSRTGATPTFSRFDWEGSVMMKLGFSDLSKFLQVFRGECESIDDGKGLYHVSARASTKISLCHQLDSGSGYCLNVQRTFRDDSAPIQLRFVFNSVEALGLSEAIAGSLPIVCFGIPMVIRREKKEVLNETVS